MIVRVWNIVPPLHVAVQSEYAPKADTMQLIGQRLVLQDWVVVRAGQAAPPFCGLVVTVLVHTCVPPPHVTGHAEQVDVETTQSIGQRFALHGTFTVRTGQAAPL